MKEGRQLVKEAVQDAKSLKQAALDSAKNEIIGALAPGLKALLEKTVRESVDRYSGSESDYTSEKERKYEEGKDKGEPHMDDKQDKMKAGELDMESLAAFFPQLAEIGAEMDGEEPAMGDEHGEHGEEKPEEEGLGALGIPTLGEEEGYEDDGSAEMHKEGKDKDDEEGDMDENVEISEAELRKVYEQALQTEVTVKKNFSDFTASGELDQVSKETGIADKKNGESFWEKDTPPDAEDWIPENVQKLVRQGMAENKQLRKQRNEAYKAVKSLIGKLQEVNLFNAKVLHVNRLLNKHGKLSVEQKKIAIESLDKAKSISEVKTIFEAIDGTFALTAKSLSESNTRKPTASAQKARTSGAPNQQVLRESVDRGSNQGNSRWAKLAGLVNK